MKIFILNELSYKSLSPLRQLVNLEWLSYFEHKFTLF